MSENERVLVTGAGGFIGHHLTKYLVSRGYWVRGVDIREPEFEASETQEFELLDLTKWGKLSAGYSRHRRSLWFGGKHGRHRIHRG
ncbi:MAG: NAD-dependent epimerase/dehydratase family protein [Pyrinomonadaceae bacterium]